MKENRNNNPSSPTKIQENLNPKKPSKSPAPTPPPPGSTKNSK